MMIFCTYKLLENSRIILEKYQVQKYDFIKILINKVNNIESNFKNIISKIKYNYRF